MWPVTGKRTPTGIQHFANALPTLCQCFKPFNGKAFMYVFRWEFTKYFFHGIRNPWTWLLTISFSLPKWSLKLLFSAVYFLCMVKNINVLLYLLTAVIWCGRLSWLRSQDAVETRSCVDPLKSFKLVSNMTVGNLLKTASAELFQSRD